MLPEIYKLHIFIIRASLYFKYLVLEFGGQKTTCIQVSLMLLNYYFGSIRDQTTSNSNILFLYAKVMCDKIAHFGPLTTNISRYSNICGFSQTTHRYIVAS